MCRRVTFLMLSIAYSYSNFGSTQIQHAYNCILILILQLHTHTACLQLHTHTHTSAPHTYSMLTIAYSYSYFSSTHIHQKGLPMELHAALSKLPVVTSPYVPAKIRPSPQLCCFRKSHSFFFAPLDPPLC